MNTYQYGVLPWHGFFGDFATIVSAHKTSEAAITAARRGRYINERGEVVYPRAVVFRESGFAKGDRIWSNAYPEVIPFTDRFCIFRSKQRHSSYLLSRV